MSVRPSFSNIGPGYQFGGARAEVMAKRLAYLKKHGSAWLMNGESPPAPGWPQMQQATGLSWSTKQDHYKKAHLKAVIADFIADGGTQKEAALSLGISKSYAGKLWREIVRDMGWQAQ